MTITITHTLDPINVLAVFAAITIGGSVVWPLAEMLERRVVAVWSIRQLIWLKITKPFRCNWAGLKTFMRPNWKNK